jgi:hypothetical protein
MTVVILNAVRKNVSDTRGEADNRHSARASCRTVTTSTAEAEASSRLFLSEVA